MVVLGRQWWCWEGSGGVRKGVVVLGRQWWCEGRSGGVRGGVVG